MCVSYLKFLLLQIGRTHKFSSFRSYLSFLVLVKMCASYLKILHLLLQIGCTQKYLAPYKFLILHTFDRKDKKSLQMNYHGK